MRISQFPFTRSFLISGRRDLHRLPPLRRLPGHGERRHQPQAVGHPPQGLHLHLQGALGEGQQPQVQPGRAVDRLRRGGGGGQGEGLSLLFRLFSYK